MKIRKKGMALVKRAWRLRKRAWRGAIVKLARGNTIVFHWRGYTWAIVR